MTWRDAADQWSCDRCGTTAGSDQFDAPDGWYSILRQDTDLDACSPGCLVELATRLLPADGGDTPAVETTGTGAPIPGGQHCNGGD